MSAYDDGSDAGGSAVARRPSIPVALPEAAPGVTLWWSDLDHEPDDVAPVAPWLSPEEHARAARFGTDALRRRYIAGRAALRCVLGGTLGVAPDVVPIRRGARGRPELALADAGVDFNVSHTHGGALIGVARGLPPAARIGVDVERADRQLGTDRLARKFLSDGEQAGLLDLDADARRLRFLRYWTCKEAMSKATGDGLVAPFGRITIGLGPPLEVRAGPSPYAPEAWRLFAAAVPSGFLATIALWAGIDAVAPRAPAT